MEKSKCRVKDAHRPQELDLSFSNIINSGPKKSQLDRIRKPLQFSPVTDLAYNLEELSTWAGETPKRRLSLGNDNTPSPLFQPINLSKQLSNSADKLCSPAFSTSTTKRVEDFTLFKESPLELKGTVFKRFQSMPVPFCGFDPSPPNTHCATRLSDTFEKCNSISPDKRQRKSPSLKLVCSPPHFQLGCSPSPAKVASPLKSPLKNKTNIINNETNCNDVHNEDDDNSRDSGVCLDKDAEFKFPLGPAPRVRTYIDENSNSPLKSHNSPLRPKSAPIENVRFFSTILESPKLQEMPGSPEKDDGYLDMVDLKENQENIPIGMEGLFRAPVLTKSNSVRFDELTPSRKAADKRLHAIKENSPRRPSSSRRGLFRSPSTPVLIERSKPESRAFGNKRSEPHSREEDHSFRQIKRRKSLVMQDENQNQLQKPTPRRLVRCQSEDTIKMALNRGDVEPDLVGDFSRSYCLPTVKGKHQDLKSITPATLVALMNGEYNHSVEKFTIVDNRYPYEFEGGHIRGAKNIYVKDDIYRTFMGRPQEQPQDSNKRNIIIFHCEFSSERGPSMSRFLRNKDRDAHKDTYPELAHPELYLLDGGYKNFFGSFKEYCDPQEYKLMLNPKHSDDLKHFRIKSKSWSGAEKSSRPSFRPGLKF